MRRNFFDIFFDEEFGDNGGRAVRNNQTLFQLVYPLPTGLNNLIAVPLHHSHVLVGLFVGNEEDAVILLNSANNWPGQTGAKH